MLLTTAATQPGTAGTGPTGTGATDTSAPAADMHRVARDLESAFLAEMLKQAGVGAPRDSFGGGIGEEQFGSFLRQELARDLAEAGGIGLAESLFRAIARAEARNG